MRLGRAVLIDTEYGEGSDALGQVERQVGDMTDAGADVVSMMCRFTEAGC
ncbi:hypothetical protein BH11ACT8_BH11ACT8_18950 [soil metagenome]